MHPAFVWYWKRRHWNAACETPLYADCGPSRPRRRHSRHERHGRHEAGLGLSGRRHREEDPLFGGSFGTRRPLRYLASRLDFTPEQFSAASKLLESLKTERAQASVDLRRASADLADALEGTEFDAERARSAHERRLAAAQRVQEAVTRTLEQMHALLDDEQRQELAALLRSGAVRF